MNGLLRFGIRMPPCRPVDEVARAVSVAEDLGFSHAWFPDSQLLWRDPFATLVVAALSTRKIGLGLGVTNVATRHLSVLASTIGTAQEVAGSRLVVGLGSGFSAVAPVGLRRSRPDELAAGIEGLRALLSGEPWSFDGVEARLAESFGPAPIYLAAGGPRALALAGRTADGVIVLSAADAGRLDRNLTTVRDAARAAGRDPDRLDMVVTTFCHITDDPEGDLRLLKPICLGMAQLGNQAMLAGCGIDLPDPGHVEGVYPDMLHANDWERAMEIADGYVTDEMAAMFAEHACLWGTPDVVARRIADMQEVGMTSIFFQGIGSYELPFDLMHRTSEDLMGRFGGAR